MLLFIDNIICDIQANNVLEQLFFDLSKFVAKLINKNIDLLDINKSRIVKSKEQSIEAKNKKATIIKVEKTKRKSTRKNLFDFKYIDAAIKVLRNSKYTIKRDKRDRRDRKVKKNRENNCNKAIQNK